MTSLEKAKSSIKLQGQKILKLGKDDPRRVTHSIKVGLSLTLVSLVYLLEPVYKAHGVIIKEINENILWAVMTVVVVLEFTAGKLILHADHAQICSCESLMLIAGSAITLHTVYLDAYGIYIPSGFSIIGATFCKGFNRGLGTLSAGMLAFLMEYIAIDCGIVSRAIIIGFAVFVVGATATYFRFLPYIKQNFDYGVVIFVLTFNLIAVSSYRVGSVLKIARDRFYTIAIGCVICLVMTVLVFPNWSGEDLHNSTVRRLEGLAKAIEACVSGYFNNEAPHINEDEPEKDPVYLGYKAILDSKSADETMALHASWEPRHSRQKRFPGKQYVQLGGVIRQFAYTVVALHGCIQTEIQTPRHVRALFKDPCTRLAEEVSRVLKELANSISNHYQCSPEILSDHLHEALKGLNTTFKAQPRLFIGPATSETSDILAQAAAVAASNADKYLSGVDSAALLSEWRLSKRASNRVQGADKNVLRPSLSKITLTSLEFSEALPFAAFSSLLIEIVAKLEIVIKEVEELGKKAKFKECNQGDNVTVTVIRPEINDQMVHPE